MREIKFRAWDTDEGEMYYGLDKILHEWDGFRGRLYHLFDGSQPIMQYTGLKDKSNREIYEGDITESYNSLYRIFWSDELACFMMAHRGNEKMSTLMPDGNDCEVIGNIYENPELLEQK